MGESSAALILSVREQVGVWILDRYRGKRVSTAGVSFLWDWFLRNKPRTAAGWIECDEADRLLGFETLTDLRPDRDSLLTFGAETAVPHGILLVNDGDWSSEAFAFLDGVLGARGGRLHSVCILRRRKLIQLWNGKTAPLIQSRKSIARKENEPEL